MKSVILQLTIALVCFGCNGQKPVTTEEQPTPEQPSTTAASRPAVVYRTVNDHRNHVPVQLGDDGSIVSYPHPRDLRKADGYALPIELEDGYLLDERGIGTNVAFLDIDHATYAAMEHAPSLKELEAMIIDRDPLSEFYDCGSRSNYSDLQEELAEMVRSNSLESRCKRLK